MTAATLPPKAQAIVEAERVPFSVACRFLGMSTTAGYPKAHRYLARVTKLTKQTAFDVKHLRPRRDPATGDYTEIPVAKVGKLMCRADLLVPMVYPEVGWPDE